MGFIGYFFLAWVVTRGHAYSLGSWKWWLVGCIAIHALLVAAAPSGDVHRYLWEGRVQLAGLNPYRHPPVDPLLAELRDDDWEKINHPDYPAIYGPVAQVQFLVAAAGLPSRYTLKVLHVLWNVLVIMVLAECLRRTGRAPHAAILYGLCPLVLTAFAIEGHVDSLMLALVAATMWAVLRGRTDLAGVLLGLAMATKIVPVVLLPWFAVRRRRAMVIALAVFVLCHIPYLSAGWDVFASLWRFGGSSEFFSMLGALSVTSFSSSVARGLTLAVLAAVLILLAWRRRDFSLYGLSAFEALLLLMPVVHYWYLSWVLLLTPFRVRLRWAVMALAMVMYFEVELRRQTTGVWSIPRWTPLVVWLTFVATWCVELWVRQRPRPR